MKYNRLSDRGPLLRIEVYILLLSRTSLRKAEGAAMGSIVSAVIANLHIESYRSIDNLIILQSWFAKTLIGCYSV